MQSGTVHLLLQSSTFSRHELHACDGSGHFIKHEMLEHSQVVMHVNMSPQTPEYVPLA
jgi:hypothetical protein